MEKYRILGTIKKDGKEFNVYIDTKYQKFYLRRTEDGNLIYPTLEEYTQLNKRFKVNSKEMIFTEIESKEGSKIKSAYLANKKKVAFEPKIIFRNTLISLASALTLTGCGVSTNIDGEEVDIFKIEPVTQTQQANPIEASETCTEIEETEATEQIEQTEPPVETAYTAEVEESSETTTFVEEQLTDKDALEQYGFSLEELEKDVLIPYVVRLNDGSTERHCRTLDEFKQYAGINGNMTFENLIEALNSNPNIGDTYREWIYDGIINLQNSGQFNSFDFSVLYYNLKRLQINEGTMEQIKEMTGMDRVVARFNSKQGNVLVSIENANREVFDHEIFGHATTGAYIDNGNSKASYRFDMISVALNTDEAGNRSCVSNWLGDALEEGKAEYLTKFACPEYEYRYKAECEEFRLMMELTETNVSQAINMGIEEMVKILNQKGVQNVTNNIVNMDALCNAMLDSSFTVDSSVLFENNMKDLLVKYGTAELNNGRHLQDIQQKMNGIVGRANYSSFSVENGAYGLDSVSMDSFLYNVNNDLYIISTKQQENTDREL